MRKRAGYACEPKLIGLSGMSLTKRDKTLGQFIENTVFSTANRHARLSLPLKTGFRENKKPFENTIGKPLIGRWLQAGYV